eukprot:613338-Lingulodinium_polyedra.AAC.1
MPEWTQRQLPMDATLTARRRPSHQGLISLAHWKTRSQSAKQHLASAPAKEQALLPSCRDFKASVWED